MRGRHGPANWNFIAKLESKDPRICVSGLNKLPVATIAGVSSSSQSIGCALWFSAIEAKKSRERSSAKKSREQGARERTLDAHRSHSTRKSKGSSRRACRRRSQLACVQAKHTSSQACRMPMTPGTEGQTGRVRLVWPSAACTLAIAVLLCAPATHTQPTRSHGHLRWAPTNTQLCGNLCQLPLDRVPVPAGQRCHDRVQMNSKMRSPA